MVNRNKEAILAHRRAYVVIIIIVVVIIFFLPPSSSHIRVRRQGQLFDATAQLSVSIFNLSLSQQHRKNLRLRNITLVTVACMYIYFIKEEHSQKMHTVDVEEKHSEKTKWPLEYVTRYLPSAPCSAAEQHLQQQHLQEQHLLPIPNIFVTKLIIVPMSSFPDNRLAAEEWSLAKQKYTGYAR